MGATRRNNIAVALVAVLLTLVSGLAVAAPSTKPGDRATEVESSRPAANPEAKRKRKKSPKRKRKTKRSSSKTKAERGGINPCMTPDPGYGIYDEFFAVGAFGRMLAPQVGGITKSGAFDLIVHFHGRYPIRKEFVREAKGTVLVAVDLGISSAPYNNAFSNPHAFPKLLEAIEAEMAKRSGNPKAHVRKLALSSWSAGFGAIEQILRQSVAKKVDALILLDSVHTGYDDPKSKKLRESGVEPFLEFAKHAARGRGLMYQTFSSIIPPGYASTREVAHFMVNALGGKVKSTKRDDLYGLEMFERFDRGNYKVRGYKGNDKPDHCAHLGLMREVMRTLINPRWHSPVGRKGKRAIAKAKSAARANGSTYIVKSGDSLGKIARRHSITVKELRDANGLTKKSPAIQPGDELVIPGGSKKDDGAKNDKPKSKPKSPKPGPGEKIHQVAKGQSLGAIAKRYNVTVAAIRERNDLPKGGRRIQPGDKLIIPIKG